MISGRKEPAAGRCPTAPAEGKGQQLACEASSRVLVLGCGSEGSEVTGHPLPSGSSAGTDTRPASWCPGTRHKPSPAREVLEALQTGVPGGGAGARVLPLGHPPALTPVSTGPSLRGTHLALG